MFVRHIVSFSEMDYLTRKKKKKRKEKSPPQKNPRIYLTFGSWRFQKDNQDCI